MNLEHETLCPVCNDQREYLNHELTVMPVIREGAKIGITPMMKVVNVQFFCQNCGVNQSKPWQYEDAKFVPVFIEDVKSVCTVFKEKKYMDFL